MWADMPVEPLVDVEFAYPTITSLVGLVARRILRELGLVAVSPRWGTPERTIGLSGNTAMSRGGLKPAEPARDQ